MKLIKIAPLVFLFAATAQEARAQGETYTVPITAASNVVKLDLGRVLYNEETCTRINAAGAPSCSQAQACVAANVVGGASCTAADALAAGVRIYPNTLAGREGFTSNELVKSKLPEFVQKQAEKAMLTFRLSCLAANQAAKDAICTGIGQAPGCGICDAFQ